MIPHLDIHADILKHIDMYIKNKNVPNIIFHGPTGAGKKFIINTIIDKLYDTPDIDGLVMYVNCAHGKGIKFIRDDLKHFSKTNILATNLTNFKTVVLINADKLTIDAQSALRRCIELFSHSTRFFISVENIHKLLKPILSRFCDIYIPRPTIRGTSTSLYQTNIKQNGHFYRNSSKNAGKLAKILESTNMNEQNTVELTDTIYGKGFSAQNLIELSKTYKLVGTTNKIVDELSFIFHKIKREFRSEKTLILFVLNFLFFRRNTELENITII